MPTLHTADDTVQWLRSHLGVAGRLHTDSRLVGLGDVFVAWPGAANDGRAYVQAAMAQGAAACLVEQAGAESYHFDSSKVALLEGLQAKLGEIAAAIEGQPSQRLRVLAVTGTNGKTSVSWWLAQALAALPEPQACGVVGTLGAGRLGQLLATGLTTPDPVVLQQTFADLLQAQVGVCAIEASSIGIAEQRLAGTHIHTAVFTNFSQDHLDYHGSMADYWAAKAQLFVWPGLRAAVVWVDDPQGAALAEQLGGLDVWTVSAQRPARLQARAVRMQPGLCFEVGEGEQRHPVHTALLGDYNVANLLCVIAGLRSLGVPLAQAAQACQALRPVPGRMDCQGGTHAPLAVVDYAHTPDALEKTLRSLRAVAQQRGGRLWCVFGCGGGRDPLKRPLMGAVAGQYADAVLLTSDNPRHEHPPTIISHILRGLAGRADVQVQADRAQAIAQALRAAHAADVVLIAGKGHEATQDTAGVAQPFSDQEHVRLALQNWELVA